MAILRIAMVVGFPVLAIAGACVIAYGVLVVPQRMAAEWRAAVIEAYEAEHPEIFGAEVELDAALAKLLGPADDWTAAGLPRHERDGRNHGYINELTAFGTKRRFGNAGAGGWMKPATMRINTPAGLVKAGALDPVFGANTVTLAAGEIGAQPGPVGWWRVVCLHPPKHPGVTHQLTGDCVFGGVWVRVEFGTAATPEQGAGFEPLIRAIACRMPAACGAELAPYIARMNASPAESR